MKLAAVILLKIKHLRSLLKSATEQLELCTIATDDARKELMKCKKGFEAQHMSMQIHIHAKHVTTSTHV